LDHGHLLKNVNMYILLVEIHGVMMVSYCTCARMDILCLLSITRNDLAYVKMKTIVYK
jgi:hypothetical protein